VKFLVIGLGSMGTRRVRNLQHLGYRDIAGFDSRSDRRENASEKYGISTYESFDHAIDNFSPSILIISVPPDIHCHYINLALKLGINCFIEASVTDHDELWRLSREVENSDLIIAPSCTMKYCLGPIKVKDLVLGGTFGKPLNFIYHTGQYLPDWHPWENINDFYVSKRETGGCREIVPFELVWLNDIFGYPNVISSVKSKLSDLDADIDDIYQFSLIYPKRILGLIIIDVLAKPEARRELFINLEKGQIVFSAHEKCVRYIREDDSDWSKEDLAIGTVEDGYINPEEPYINEMRDFIKACKDSDPRQFPNTLLNDWSVLNLLSTIETVSTSF